MANVTLIVGQSVTLFATPLVNGNPGGNFMNPVNWTHNAANNGQQVNLTPSADTKSCVLQTVSESGALQDTCIVLVEQQANGLRIDVGAVN